MAGAARDGECSTVGEGHPPFRGWDGAPVRGRGLRGATSRGSSLRLSGRGGLGRARRRGRRIEPRPVEEPCAPRRGTRPPRTASPGRQGPHRRRRPASGVPASYPEMNMIGSPGKRVSQDVREVGPAPVGQQHVGDHEGRWLAPLQEVQGLLRGQSPWSRDSPAPSGCAPAARTSTGRLRRGGSTRSRGA